MKGPGFARETGLLLVRNCRVVNAVLRSDVAVEMKPRWPLLAILCALASMLFPGIASAHGAAGAENRVWAFDLAEQVHVAGQQALTLELHQGYEPADYDSASGSLLAAGGGSRAPDFVVTPRGEAIRVPIGATGPTSTRASGVQYTGGAGGHGLDSRVSGVRIMEGNANQGPRAVYMNSSGQTVKPATGRTVPNSDPSAHHYLNPWE